MRKRDYNGRGTAIGLNIRFAPTIENQGEHWWYSIIALDVKDYMTGL